MAVFGYWDIRGLAQADRLVFRYTGTPVTEKVYPQSDRSAWLADKQVLAEKLAYSNLPYYLDDANGVYLTQSSSILRYVGRKGGLMGATPEETARVEMTLDEVVDVRSKVSGARAPRERAHTALTWRGA